MKKVIVFVLVLAILVIAGKYIYKGDVQASRAELFLETMKKDLNITSPITERSGRMGLKDGTIANSVMGFELSWPTFSDGRDNSYVYSKLQSDGLGTNASQNSQGYTDGNIACDYGVRKGGGTNYIFCIDLEG
jgi:hypothetical protein